MTGQVLCIIPGPSKVLREQPVGERWCFGCRQRLPHTLRILCDEEPSYYDPIAVLACDRCGKDRTEFPRGEWR
jgi:hypothetical protein